MQQGQGGEAGPAALWNGRYITGTEGMTIPQLEREVMRGGRFAYFHWCFSPLVWTFSRKSPVRFYRVGGEGGDAWKWTLITLLAGWWSIPGFVFVIMCVVRNMLGGVDMTYEMMGALIGPR